MKTFTVGQVNNYIKNLVTQDYMLKSLSVKGEVSNCKYHSLGHIYFSLKDETGSIPAVMFKGNVSSGLSFKLKDGMSVIASGSMGVYERDGRYQLYVNKLSQDGTGRLYEEFERLKYKLNDEGLFDCDIKKAIPKYPKRVGIVTAKTGAAIQDIMNIARRRNPYVQLILCPAKVQGEGAADTIADGIRRLDEMCLDTIIVGRGGGSMEDLWAFNEEKVVRAIYEAKTPIISGVGHEIDITLSDYAADLRAPTPSAACELAIPDIISTIQQVDKLAYAMSNSMQQRISSAGLILEKYKAVLDSRSPAGKLSNNNQRLSELSDRIKYAIDNRYSSYKHRLEILTAKIDGLSPTAKLINGFGFIECEAGTVCSARTVKPDDELRITLHDGVIMAKVTGVNRE